MTIFMVWHCTNNPADIRPAVERYETKYQRRPDICLVNPTLALINAPDMAVKHDQHVLPGDIWLGVQEMIQDGK